ncbi:hypothetical protein [Streptomyces turgidiscabies]|uniref:Membrane protein YfcA n=1 Tax=Streptomyces turgidiscabies TaxID=85558 RepID=A0ABU0S056_9ACTN|nr:hypothetical protein [Streptomyces turgidiscabies]MDQ0937615.1 putative membrane protein YfcA [Streptomyces turgidiscabies]
MFYGRNDYRPRDLTQAWFWEEAFTAVCSFIGSRAVWVALGNAATLLSALAALVYYWSRPVSFAGYVVVQLACLVCQAVALIPVIWPGREVTGYSDLHQTLTVTTVAGSFCLVVCPGAILLTFLHVDAGSPPWDALISSGSAFMLAGVVGGMAGTFLSDRENSGDSADVDSGGFDGN